MKIVIDIPEETYEKVCTKENPYRRLYEDIALEAIQKGTQLPEGHGRLIDVNDLLDDIGLEDCEYNRDVNMGEIITLENIDRIPTIIEADKEGKTK